LDRGPNRAVADDLTERTERTDSRSGVQVCSGTVLNLADLGTLVMVVKDFSRIEMKLTREQRAHNQGMHPDLEPKFSPAPHLLSSLFLGLDRTAC
jgi:hypothetical protein